MSATMLIGFVVCFVDAFSTLSDVRSAWPVEDIFRDRKRQERTKREQRPLDDFKEGLNEDRV